MTRQKVQSFIDAIQNVTSKGSFYNSKESQIVALKKLHEDVRKIDPDLYSLFMFYPGINDYNKLNIIGNVLSDKTIAGVNLPVVGNRFAHDSFVNVLRDMGYARVMRFFLECKERKINNKRLKRTILQYVLGDPGLVNRTLQYRGKMKEVLEHAWGKRQATALVSIAQKSLLGSIPSNNQKFIEKELVRYKNGKVDRGDMLESLCFVFKSKMGYRNEVFAAYEGAKMNISIGLGKLPRRTLIGIRNNHHKDFDLATLYAKTEKQQSAKDKVSTVRASERAGRKVKVSSDTFSVRKADELYKFAYEMGMTDELRDGINKNVDKLVEKFDFNFKNVALVIDNSQSMGGKEATKNGPISKALAFAKFLEKSSESCKRFYTSEVEDEQLPELTGESCYAKPLIKAAKTNPDIIFILGDGYENSPEGLTALTIKGLRSVGFDKKIVHVNPVFAVESGKARTISDEVNTLPFNDLNKLEGSFTKSVFESRLGDVGFLKTYLFGYAYKYYGLKLTGPIKKELEGQKKIDFAGLLELKQKEGNKYKEVLL